MLVCPLPLLPSSLSSFLFVVVSLFFFPFSTAFLVGGLKFTQQPFSKSAARTNITLLLLACLSLLLPMVLIATTSTVVVNTSTTGGVIGIVDAPSGGTVLEEEGISPGNVLILSRFTSVLLLVVYALLILYQLRTHAHLFDDDEAEGEEEEEDEDEAPLLGPWGSIIWALIITVFISVLSEFIGRDTHKQHE